MVKQVMTIAALSIELLHEADNRPTHGVEGANNCKSVSQFPGKNNIFV